MDNNTTTPPAGGQTPPAGDPPGQTPTTPPAGQTPPGDQTPPTGTNTRTTLDALPQDVQDMIRDLRREAKELRQSRDAELAAKAAAEQTRLKEQGEYKQLAETHEARVKELEPVADRYKQLSEIVNEQIKAEVRDWPAELKTFDPGPSAAVETRLEWVHKSRPLVAKLAGAVAGQAPGSTPSPPPVGQQSGGQGEVDELRRRYRDSGKYAF